MNGQAVDGMPFLDVLQPGEVLLWSGRPDMLRVAWMAASILLIGLLVWPWLVLFLVQPASLFWLFARDSYAMTNQRILNRSHSFLSAPVLHGLTRTETLSAPALTRSGSGLIFRGPYRCQLNFRFLGRKTVNGLRKIHASQTGMTS